LNSDYRDSIQLGRVEAVGELDCIEIQPSELSERSKLLWSRPVYGGEAAELDARIAFIDSLPPSYYL